MRIACLTEHYPVQSEQFIQREVIAIHEAGHEIIVWPCGECTDVSVWREPFGKPMPPLVGKDDFCFSPALKALFGCGLLQLRRIANVMRAVSLLPWRPDIIWANFCGLPAVIGCSLAGGLNIPLVVSAHARDAWVPWIPGITATEFASRLVVCNKAVAGRLSEITPSGMPVQIIHHGLPDTVFEKRVTQKIPGQILAVGRLVKKKGFDVLLRAFALLCEKSTDASLKIIGSGPEMLHLGQLANELSIDRSRLEFAGSMPPEDVMREMAASCVLAAPSVVAPDGDRDGIPNVVLEAFAQGTPVVGTSTGGLGEVLVDGENAWIVGAGDAQMLANALLESVTSPEECVRRGNNGRQKTEDDFRQSENVSGLLKIFESCIE